MLDLSDPSPALGWRSRERPAFVDRVRPDLVLCLAVVHHLALTNTVPLDEIVAFLADFGAPLVVEFPHDDDPMAARLLARKRAGVFDAYHRDNWERALAARFDVHATETLPGGTRTLYRAGHADARPVINLDESRSDPPLPLPAETCGGERSPMLMKRVDGAVRTVCAMNWSIMVTVVTLAAAILGLAG